MGTVLLEERDGHTEPTSFFVPYFFGMSKNYCEPAFNTCKFWYRSLFVIFLKYCEPIRFKYNEVQSLSPQVNRTIYLSLQDLEKTVDKQNNLSLHFAISG